MRASGVAGLVAILVVGCSTGPGKPGASAKSPSRATGTQPVVVTRDTGGAPERCTPAAIGEFIVKFFSALNAGHLSNVDAFFAPPGVFQWYSDAASSTPRINDSTVRATLARYFKDRHRHREHLRLLELDLGITHRDTGDTGDFGYWLERTADDLPPRGYTPGKGAVDCATGKIMVWSIGGPQPALGSFDGNFCPEPTRPVSEGAAIVCARP